MKKHPFASLIRIEYWYLYREIEVKREAIKLRKALSLYLEILETSNLVDRLCNHGGIYSVHRPLLVSPDLISAIKWELQSIDSDIEYSNNRIMFQRNRIRKLDCPLG